MDGIIPLSKKLSIVFEGITITIYVVSYNSVGK